MDTYRAKKAAEWFYQNVFREEPIIRKKPEAAVKLPSLLRTARSLENGMNYQSRESIFLKQGKLLAAYEDDFDFHGNVVRYFPTYQSLTDEELRGYFAWRTKLRKGDVQKTCLSFAFLYIYELINGIGVADPMEGYQKLKAFETAYGGLDGGILPYLSRWLTDYVIFYRLDASLLAESPQVHYDNCITILENIAQQDTQKVMWAVKTLAPKWLERSKFYNEYREDCDEIIVRALRKMAAHYATRCKKGMVEQFFGVKCQYQTTLFTSAVFCDRNRESFDYPVDEQCIYRCRGGLWTVEKYSMSTQAGKKLNDLMKTMDAVIREEFHYRHPIKCETETKWIIKLIREEAQALLEEKKQADARKVTIDFSRLDKIRSDAAVTREKLIVEEEEWEISDTEDTVENPPAVDESFANDSGLAAAEYQLLQCLLYGRDISWVHREGLLLSVLVDSINEKLYDTFMDTVLDDTPALIEDYIDELKEMVMP